MILKKFLNFWKFEPRDSYKKKRVNRELEFRYPVSITDKNITVFLLFVRACAYPLGSIQKTAKRKIEIFRRYDVISGTI